MEACELYDGKSNQLEGSAIYSFSVQLSSRFSLHIFKVIFMYCSFICLFPTNATMTPPLFKIKDVFLRKRIVNILCAASTFVHFFKKDSVFQSLSVSYTLIGLNKLFSLSPHFWECIVKKSDSPVHTVFTNVISKTILNFFNILYLVVLLIFSLTKIGRAHV